MFKLLCLSVSYSETLNKSGIIINLDWSPWLDNTKCIQRNERSKVCPPLRVTSC